VGPEKYDETTAVMIARLKYGSGTPFHRLEKLEGQPGIRLPAATGDSGEAERSSEGKPNGVPG
jgi:hypothetical protein